MWENHCETPVGVSDWLVSSGQYPYGAFRLADGGTVVWDASGRASQIIDPYGQTSTIIYTFNTITVTEPGGRYLYFTYGTQQVMARRYCRELEAHGFGKRHGY